MEEQASPCHDVLSLRRQRLFSELIQTCVSVSVNSNSYTTETDVTLMENSSAESELKMFDTCLNMVAVPSCIEIRTAKHIFITSISLSMQ